MDGCHSSQQGANGAMSYSGRGTFHPHWGHSQEDRGCGGRGGTVGEVQSWKDFSGRCASNHGHTVLSHSKAGSCLMELAARTRRM